MSQGDIVKVIPAGAENIPVRAGGDFVFLKESPKEVKVTIDGQSVLMRRGDKRRIDRKYKDRIAFDSFEVSNTYDADIRCLFVVGEGDYNSQIVTGEIYSRQFIENSLGERVSSDSEEIVIKARVSSPAPDPHIADNIVRTVEWSEGDYSDLEGRALFVRDGVIYQFSDSSLGSEEGSKLHKFDVKTGSYLGFSRVYGLDADDVPWVKSSASSTVFYDEKTDKVYGRSGFTLSFGWDGLYASHGDLIANIDNFSGIIAGAHNGEVFVSSLGRLYRFDTDGVLMSEVENIGGVTLGHTSAYFYDRDNREHVFLSSSPAYRLVFDEDFNFLRKYESPDFEYIRAYSTVSIGGNLLVCSDSTGSPYGNGVHSIVQNYNKAFSAGFTSGDGYLIDRDEVLVDCDVSISGVVGSEVVRGQVIKALLIAEFGFVPDDYLDYIVSFEYWDGVRFRRFFSGGRTFKAAGFNDDFKAVFPSEFKIKILKGLV